MNRILHTLRITSVLALLQIFILISMAQEKPKTATLTNDTVIELVKAGISENIILSKIKIQRLTSILPLLLW